jgi:hypothetical protein
VTMRLPEIESVYGAAFGAPQVVEGRTLIPLRRVAGCGGSYDFGRFGGGSGGMMLVRPLGVYDVSDSGARWVPIRARRRLLVVGITGLAATTAIGVLLWRRRRGGAQRTATPESVAPAAADPSDHVRR